MTRITLFLLAALFAVSAGAAEFKLVWGVNVEPIIYYKQAAQRFKANVESRSAGRISVKLIENQFTEKDRDHLKDVQTGLYDMGQAPVSYLEKQIPELSVWDLPFLFETDYHVLTYMQSPQARNTLEKLKPLGVHPVDYTYSGGFLFVIGGPLKSFADQKGFPLGQESCGAAYKEFMEKKLRVTLTDADYPGLIKKNPKVETAEIIGATIDEVFPISREKEIFLNKTDHRVITRILYISNKFLDSLPADLRKIVLEEAKTASEFEKQLSIADKNRKLKILKENGMVLNEWTEKQKAVERKIFAPMYKKFSKKFGAEIISGIKALPKAPPEKVSQNAGTPGL